MSQNYSLGKSNKTIEKAPKKPRSPVAHTTSRTKYIKLSTTRMYTAQNNTKGEKKKARSTTKFRNTVIRVNSTYKNKAHSIQIEQNFREQKNGDKIIYRL